MFTKLPTNPGVYKDDTPLNATGFYIDANKVRWVRGVPQSFGGWELLTSTTIAGYCRGIHTWVDGSLLQWLALGTHTNLYGVNDSVVYDCTPVSSRGLLTNPFTTTIGLTSVNVDHTAHGRAVGDGVFYSGASAVGGLTISGNYTVTTVVSANAYTITAASAATGSAGPGGGSVKFSYYLAIGLASATFALGYGTGLYSAGTYSTASTGVPYARTWSICDYGPNMVACPRGGKVYEWNPLPDTTPNEIVQNPTFAAGTGWTAGAGWSLNVGNAASTLSNAALSQVSLIVPPMGYTLLDVNCSAYTTGTVNVAYNGVTLASITAVGRYTAEFYNGNAGTTGTLALNALSATVTVTEVSMTPCASAVAMTNAPTTNTCVVVTPDKFVMVCGTIEVNTGLFNPMHIRWSDIAPNHHTWIAGTNQSGSWTLAIGSRIVAARVSNNEILIWTDKALYSGTYTNNTAQPYIFRQIGVNCGAIGSNAMAVLGGIAYWLAPNGYFFRYAGGGAEPMQSTIRKDVFDNIAFVQQDKIFATAIAQYQDLMWLYPDARDGTQEVSRYALCDTQEPAPLMGGPPPPNLGVWAPGTFTRTAWVDAGIFQYPIAVDYETPGVATGKIYYQEKGDTANGGNIAWSLETAAYELGSGDTLYTVGQFIPDFDVLRGGCTYTPYSWMYAQATPTAHGPFMILSTTTTVDMMTDPPLGRQIAHKFDGNASPCSMRGGAHQMDIDDTGMEY